MDCDKVTKGTDEELEYILTCTRGLAAKDPYGELISVQKRPPIDGFTSGSSKSKHIRVQFLNALYLIPIDQCDTWFVSRAHKSLDRLAHTYLY